MFSIVKEEKETIKNKSILLTVKAKVLSTKAKALKTEIQRLHIPQLVYRKISTYIDDKFISKFVPRTITWTPQVTSNRPNRNGDVFPNSSITITTDGNIGIGTSGIATSSGPRGYTGLAGSTGPQGQAGCTGYTGLQGVTGITWSDRNDFNMVDEGDIEEEVRAKFQANVDRLRQKSLDSRPPPQPPDPLAKYRFIANVKKPIKAQFVKEGEEAEIQETEIEVVPNPRFRGGTNSTGPR